MQYLCAVRLWLSNSEKDRGAGWTGLVKADSPATAAEIARQNHRPGSRWYAHGDRIARVEVYHAGGSKIGDF